MDVMFSSWVLVSSFSLGVVVARLLGENHIKKSLVGFAGKIIHIGWFSSTFKM